MKYRDIKHYTERHMNGWLRSPGTKHLGAFSRLTFSCGVEISTKQTVGDD